MYKLRWNWLVRNTSQNVLHYVIYQVLGQALEMFPSISRAFLTPAEKFVKTL
jgi:hypothetical protein